MQEERRWLIILKKIKKHLVNYIYTILYSVLILCLSIYIIANWDACVSMQLFSHFDGNNILFLVWIALIVLFFYDVEAKDFKFHRRKDPAKEFQDARVIYTQARIDELRNDSLGDHNNGTERDGGGS